MSSHTVTGRLVHAGPGLCVAACLGAVVIVGASSTRAAVAEAVTIPADAGLESYWQALVQLRSLLQDTQAVGRELLERSAELGCGEAALLIGSAQLTESYGYTSNPQEAVRRFRQAIALGNNFARIALAECQVRGVGTDLDLAAAEAGLQEVLAPATAFSRPVPPDWYWGRAGSAREAVAGELESDPVESARANARYLLGLIAQHRGDHTAAQVEFLAAASAGRAGRAGVFSAAVEAALNLAYGRGAARDRAQAVALLEQARELQRRQGAHDVHGLAQQGFVEAFTASDLEEAVARGSRTAMAATQYRIAQDFARPGFAYHDPAEARVWCELAAGNDHVDAMITLALMQSRGEGGPVDRVEAFGWFDRAGSGPAPRALHAAACLGISYLRGLGTAADLEKAQAIFHRWRDDDFLCHLGAIGEAPADVLTADEAIQLLETRVKTQRRDVHAQYLFAKYHLWGRGFEADEDEGVRLLKAAADRGSGAACGEMGDYYTHRKADTRRAADYYRRGLRRRDARSAVGLARQQTSAFPGAVALEGTPAMAALEEARSFCEQALSFDPDFLSAHELMVVLGATTVIHDFNPATVQSGPWDPALAREHAARADELGSGLAAYYEGLWALGGVGEAVDLRRAYHRFSVAAERGHGPAHFMLGSMHENGQGVPVTLDEAAYHYQQAAVAGHLESARVLGQIYLGRRGLPADGERAITWLAVAARSGTEEDLAELARALVRNGRAADGIPILQHLSEGSGRARVLALSELARCHRLGLGVPVNREKARAYRAEARRAEVGKDILIRAWGASSRGEMTTAVALFEEAAETQPEAAFNLGQIYFFGQGVEANRERAVEYLRLAAEDDSARALFFLAGMTINREEGAPSTVEALEMARRALAGGDQKAGELVPRLEKRLRTEQE